MPIPWVKVHDLPDYAYFNHSAHVTRGIGCVSCHGRVDTLYRSPADWHHKALLNVAGMGVFSSDRTIREYADEIWHVRPLAR